MNAHESAPVAANYQGAENIANQAGLHSHNSTVYTLLDRLENKREYGRGWRAQCPAHDGKSRDVLSIAVGDDGRVLLHCFHGCSALEIVHAVGLTLNDLFPERITHNATPAERRHLRELARQSQWKAAIPLLYSEAVVVMMAAGKMNHGEALTQDDDARLMEAIERIGSARAVFNGR